MIKKFLSLFNKKQSKELTAFYRAYNEWLDSGASYFKDNPYGFLPRLGLCYALRKYCENNSSYKVLSKEMKSQFIKSGRNKIYPFGEKEYNNSADFGGEPCCYQPERVKWVKDHLKPESTGEKE